MCNNNNIAWSTSHHCIRNRGGDGLENQQEEKEHQRPRGNNHLIELHFTPLLSTKRIGGWGKDWRHKKMNKNSFTWMVQRPIQSILCKDRYKRHRWDMYTARSIISRSQTTTIKKIFPAKSWHLCWMTFQLQHLTSSPHLTSVRQSIRHI